MATAPAVRAATAMAAVTIVLRMVLSPPSS
jgi:hypothetical protein